MNNSKRANPENGVDFISSMPDSILQLILEDLPNTEEVVRTSVLSTRWRYLWTSIPKFSSLNFDSVRLRKPIADLKSSKFETFVSWALADQTVDLDSLSLWCAGCFDTKAIEMLIKAAANRNVKSLDLKFYPKVGKDFDDYLASCESLESLRLSLCRALVSLAGCKTFERLKVLELNNVYCYQSNVVEKFVNTCPLLEELSLTDLLIRLDNPICISSSKLKTLIIRRWINEMGGGIADFFGSLKVCCPKIVTFEYVGHRCQLILEEVGSLKKAVIHPEDLLGRMVSRESGKTVCKWFGGISHVDSLSLNLYFVLCIYVAKDPRGDFPASFPNLKTLELITTIDALTMEVLVHILRCSPNLESLRLIIQKGMLTSKHWELDEVEARAVTIRHLKRVEFVELTGEEQNLRIARLLLEQGNELEEMVFSWNNEVNYHEKSVETMNEVSKFHKASSTVKLIALLKD